MGSCCCGRSGQKNDRQVETRRGWGIWMCIGIFFLFNITLAMTIRLGHFSIILFVFITAMVLGSAIPKQMADVTDVENVSTGLGYRCDSKYFDECIFNQLVYRASTALIILFIILAFAAQFTPKADETNLFPIKYLFATGLFISFWWGSNIFFSGWGDLCRVVSFVYMIIQGLLLINFAEDCNANILRMMKLAVKNKESPLKWQLLYLLLTACALAGVIGGLVDMFDKYPHCDLALVFLSITVSMGALQLMAAVMVNTPMGLLTPSLIWAYNVFMCWYAIISSRGASCTIGDNAQKQNMTGGAIMACVFMALIVVYVIFFGSTILNCFNPEAQNAASLSLPLHNPMGKLVFGDDSSSSSSVQQQQQKSQAVAEEENGGVTSAGGSAKVSPEPSSSTPEPTDAVVSGGSDKPINTAPASDSTSNTATITTAAATTPALAGPPDENVSDEEKMAWRNGYFNTVIINGSVGTPHERGLFHILLIFLSGFLTMLFTRWTMSNGDQTGNASAWSMWLIIVSQWLIIIVYWQIIAVGVTKKVKESQNDDANGNTDAKGNTAIVMGNVICPNPLDKETSGIDRSDAINESKV